VYIHAERLLAKAGGSNCKGRGISHPWNEATAGVERAERSGGLHERSAEAWGNPLRARGAELPLGAFAVAFRYHFISLGVFAATATSANNLARFTSYVGMEDAGAEVFSA
jgi:hypothetical protein